TPSSLIPGFAAKNNVASCVLQLGEEHAHEDRNVGSHRYPLIAGDRTETAANAKGRGHTGSAACPRRSAGSSPPRSGRCLLRARRTWQTRPTHTHTRREAWG